MEDVQIISAIPAGDNKLGSVDVASALPAGANVIGGVTNDALTDVWLPGVKALRVVQGDIPAEPLTKRYDYPAEELFPIYEGWAKSTSATPAELTVESVTKDQNAEFTVTGSEMKEGQKVTISGATGDWAACNGEWTVTPCGGCPDHFSIEVDSTSFTGDFDGTVVTSAPSPAASVWAIRKTTYTDGKLVLVEWVGGNASFSSKWTERGTLTYW